MAANATLPYSIGNVVLSNNISVFYREAGNPANPTILLLHGFPTSSHQYRTLIPLLAVSYHVLAPDYPGFGFTTVPDSLKYEYTFDNLAATVSEFLDAKKITNYTPYLFDYGAPVGFRLLLKNPSAATTIISQNGNAYVEGLGQDFWKPIFRLWNATTPDEFQAARDVLKGILTLEGIKDHYVTGSPDPNIIEPESYTLDTALIMRPGQQDIQLGLFYDYRNNVKMYPEWQAYLRKYQPKTLAVWGENDVSFVPPGAEAFKRDVPGADVQFLDAGHFVLETNVADMARLVLEFLGKNYTETK